MDQSHWSVGSRTRLKRTEKNYVRYERSQSTQIGTRRNLSRRARAFVVLTSLVAAVIVIAVVSSGSSRYAKVTGTAEQIRSTQHVFLEANILVENLGAFTPTSGSTSTWLLTSHPISKDRRGVVGAQFPWINGTGTINVVSATRERSERIAQREVIASIFGNGAKNDALAEMNQIINGEEGALPLISASGGAEIVKWLKVQVNGTTAHLEADVNVWEASLELNLRGGRYRLTRGLNLNQVDAFATMKLSAGRWKVVSFNQAPWQQAT